MGTGNHSSTESSFQTVRLDEKSSSVDLAKLHATILRTNGRVEFTNAAGETCVLMSKSELDALERALEILSSTEDVKEMSEQLSRIAAMSVGE